MHGAPLCAVVRARGLSSRGKPRATHDSALAPGAPGLHHTPGTPVLSGSFGPFSKAALSYAAVSLPLAFITCPWLTCPSCVLLCPMNSLQICCVLHGSGKESPLWECPGVRLPKAGPVTRQQFISKQGEKGREEKNPRIF